MNSGNSHDLRRAKKSAARAVAQREAKLRLAQIATLYQAMPGAQMPPQDDRGYLWGEVDGTEHWAFCAAIVEMVHKNSSELRAKVLRTADDLGRRGLLDLADDLRLAAR